MTGRPGVIHMSVEPPFGGEPTYRLQSYENTAGIAVLACMPKSGYDVVDLSFNPEQPGDTIRYLRLLAGAATDLADELERAATTDAVLKS